MPLPDPITGVPTIENLTVLGFDSDAFRLALTEKGRANVEILALPADKQEVAKDEAELRLYAALVSGWSFKEAHSQESVCGLLREAPYIRQAIDKFASDRANFIKRQSGN